MKQEEKDIFDQMRTTNPGDSSNLARAYYDSLLIKMQYIDSVLASTDTEILGQRFSSPLAVSAISHLGKFGYGESGMVQVAKAAKDLDILDFVGWGSDEELAQIIDTGVKAIKIEKPLADMEELIRKIEGAERMGAFAVGMDIDHIFNRDGEYDNVDGIPLSAKSFDDIAALVKATKLPFVIKGVLTVSDAKKCLEAGAKGIFVSHHHGLYKYMTPPAMMLPEIVNAVGDKMTVFVDGNIESGYDAFKALALGGKSAAVGRPLLKLVKKEGADGVKRWFEKTNRELKGVMSRSGCAKIEDIDLSHLVKRGHLF